MPLQNNASPDNPALERVAAVTTTDPGIFLLAVCSFIEGYLHARYAQPGEQIEFGHLRSRLERELTRAIATPPPFRDLFRTWTVLRANV